MNPNSHSKDSDCNGKHVVVWYDSGKGGGWKCSIRDGADRVFGIHLDRVTAVNHAELVAAQLGLPLVIVPLVIV